MVRLDDVKRKFLNVDAEVGEHLVELVACGVRGMVSWYGGLEASGD